MSTTETDSIWNSIDELAEGGEPFQFDVPAEEISRTLTAREWVARRFLRGEGSVFLCALLPLVLSADIASQGGIGCTLAWAFVLAFFGRPFVRSYGGVSIGRLVALFATFVFVAPVLNLVSELAFRELSHLPLEEEMIVSVLQDNYERMLTPLVTSFLLAGFLLVVAFQLMVEKTFYWLEEPPEGKWAVFVALIPALAGLVWLMGIDYQQFWLGEREQAWYRETGARLEARPFGKLPYNSRDKFWRNEVIEPSRLLELLETHPPRSLEELDSASGYWHHAARSSDDLTLVLDYCKFYSDAQPFLIEDIEWGAVIMCAYSSKGDEEVILSWIRTLEEIKAAAPVADQSADLSAFHCSRRAEKFVELRSSVGLGSVQRGFWDSLFHRIQAQERRARALRLTELILRIKLEIARHRKPPESLAPLTENSEDFLWELKTENGKVIGELYGPSVPLAPLRFEVK